MYRRRSSSGTIFSSSTLLLSDADYLSISPFSRFDEQATALNVSAADLYNALFISRRTCLTWVVQIPNKFLEPLRYKLRISLPTYTLNNSILSIISLFLKSLKLLEIRQIRKRYALYFSVVICSFFLNYTYTLQLS